MLKVQTDKPSEKSLKCLDSTLQTRDPISIFSQIKEAEDEKAKEELEGLLGTKHP